MSGVALKGFLDPALWNQGAVEFSSFTAAPVAEPEAGANRTWHSIFPIEQVDGIADERSLYETQPEDSGQPQSK